MEDWRMWAFWTALGFNLAAGVWSLVTAIHYTRKVARLDRETLGVRPLLSADKMAALRPGDTVLMFPPLDGMTTDQQVAMIGSMKAIIEPARERGIEFIVVPDWGQKAIVVSRSALSEHSGEDVSSPLGWGFPGCRRGRGGATATGD